MFVSLFLLFLILPQLPAISSEHTVHRFLTYLKTAIELRDQEMLRELIADGFSFSTCGKERIDKQHLIDIVMVQPNGAEFGIEVLSRKDLDVNGHVEVQLEVTEFDGKKKVVAMILEGRKFVNGVEIQCD